jgi:predicted esterase
MSSCFVKRNLVERFLFPGVRASYNDNLQGLIKIPNIYQPKESDIPYVLLGNIIDKKQSIILFLHGNGEDLGNCYSYLKQVQDILNIPIMAMEYPSYGIYQQTEEKNTDEKRCVECTLSVIQFLIHTIEINDQNIVIMGRSIGTGVACHVTYLLQVHKIHIKSLILISPFSSIKNLVMEKIGWLSYFIGERFNSVQYIQNISAPVLILHGAKDRLIVSSHYQLLNDNCNKSKMKKIIFMDCDHNDIDFSYVANCIQVFLSKIK